LTNTDLYVNNHMNSGFCPTNWYILIDFNIDLYDTN